MNDQPIEINRDGHVLVIRFTNDKMRNSLTAAVRTSQRPATENSGADSKEAMSDDCQPSRTCH